MPNVNGPLYYERMGRTGPVMAFVHPNPMDQSCWIYQMARFSTWFRCVAIDIPGYGRSPTGTAEMSRFDMAQALWETLDEISPGESAVLVGCSAGAGVLAARQPVMRAKVLPWPLHWRPAVGVLEDAAVVTGYDRLPEPLAALVALQAPRGTTVLGIDAATAVVGRDGAWQVHGPARVTVWRGRHRRRYRRGDVFRL